MGKVLRWLGEDVEASGKRRHCKKKKKAVIAASPTHVDCRVLKLSEPMKKSVTPMQKVCFINSNKRSTHWIKNEIYNFLVAHLYLQLSPPQKHAGEKNCRPFALIPFSYMRTWTVCPVSVLGSSGVLPCNLRSTLYWWSSHICRAHWWCNIILYSSIAGRMTAAAVSSGRSGLLRKQ